MIILIGALKAVGGLFALMGVWLAVQAFIRRRTPGAARDLDVLEDILHGCGGCAGAHTCSGTSAKQGSKRMGRGG
jgi:hypothetical protein